MRIKVGYMTENFEIYGVFVRKFIFIVITILKFLHYKLLVTYKCQNITSLIVIIISFNSQTLKSYAAKRLYGFA